LKHPPLVANKLVWATTVLAAGLWFVAFYLSWLNFWIKISVSAAALAAISLSLQSSGNNFKPRLKDIFEGIVSAALLWGIFWIGKQISLEAFPFAENQIGEIYSKGEGFNRWNVFFLLLLITGPSEEIYWRGFLQKNLMLRFGELKGWIIATAIYASVHIWSFNFMLIGAAAVAGAYWGLHYRIRNRLLPVIISHSLWSAFVFTLVPIP